MPHNQSPLPQTRQAGVCLHLTSLPGDHGIGDLGQAAIRFVNALASAGLKVWQFLPTGPSGYGNSPYQSLSAFAGNELLVDLVELQRWGLLRARDTDTLRSLPAGVVDYDAVVPLKHALLARASKRFDARCPPLLRARFHAFEQANDKLWLHDYALFRVLKSRHAERTWQDWEPAFVHREAASLRRFESRYASEIRAVKIRQFFFDCQWQALYEHAAAKGVRLFGDMPIYVALDSVDAWSNRELLRIDADGRPDCVAGVPPDYFSNDGQLWGNPLYDWAAHAACGYHWWTERLRHAMARMDIVRIDHFRGFESYWSVPADELTARNGRWESGPGQQLFDALQAALGPLPIVAEDLGIITPAVDALRNQLGFPGMKVLHFCIAEDGFSADDIPANSVCYTGTHDNDTTVGWFQGSPDDLRSAEDIQKTQARVLDMTGGSTETVHEDLIRLAFGSRARLAIAPMQDFLGLGSGARLNTPGTTANNWRWRLERDAFTPALRNRIRTMIADAGRDGA